MKRWAGLGGTAVLLGLAASCVRTDAQITKQGDAYLLRMKFAKGKKYAYDMVSTGHVPGTSGPQSSMKFSTTMTMTVKDVQGGIATVSIQTSAPVVNGKAMGRAGQATELKLDPTGKPVGNGGGTQAVTTQFPQKPIKIGQTFSTTNAIIVMGQQMTVKATNKLAGIKKLGSRTAAVISTTTAGTGSLSMSGTGTAYLDVTDGSLVSMDVQQKITLGQGGQTVNNRVVITRK